jgi:RNA polymerase sigma-70 factor (ECF subfamily)
VASARELYGRLGRALDELSPSLRSTVIMVLIDGVPQKEAAEALGCSEGTIAWRVHEARRRLREKLGDYLDVVEKKPTEKTKVGNPTGTPAIEKGGTGS